MIKRILAISAAATATPVKPNTAAMIARTKNVKTHDNMSVSPYLYLLPNVLFVELPAAPVDPVVLLVLS